MYTETFSQFKKQLGQFDGWLTKASDLAKSKNFDPNVFPALRLSPDQFPLSRQMQIGCDTEKLAIGWEGDWMTGHNFFIEHRIPNFYFHLTTAFALQRHNGKAVGKKDYVSKQSKRPAAALRKSVK